MLLCFAPGGNVLSPSEQYGFLIIRTIEKMKHILAFLFIQSHQSLHLKALVDDIRTDDDRIDGIALP